MDEHTALLKEIKDDLSDLQTDVKIIHGALFSDLDRPGLIARVATNEKKLGWAGKVLFTVWTAILGVIFSIFKIKGA
jgi:hypothetical protein